jgi:rubredoxin
MTCPKCGSAQIDEIFDDPPTYQCEDCGHIFDK